MSQVRDILTLAFRIRNLLSFPVRVTVPPDAEKENPYPSHEIPSLSDVDSYAAPVVRTSIYSTAFISLINKTYAEQRPKATTVLSIDNFYAVLYYIRIRHILPVVARCRNIPYTQRGDSDDLSIPFLAYDS